MGEYFETESNISWSTHLGKLNWPLYFSLFIFYPSQSSFRDANPQETQALGMTLLSEQNSAYIR